MAITNVKLIYEIIEAANKASKKEERIKILRENESWGLKDVLRATYDDTIKFLLPPGVPPYTPNKEESIPSNLVKQTTKFKYFVKCPDAERMVGFKRERIFIDVLESVHPEDAKLLVKMINKESLGENITKDLVQEAFPGLILK
jgi:hypothetical protein